MAYPDDGEIFKAEQKKSDDLIFFVHFYKGNKKLLRRHIEFVNELGFDAYAFNLKDSAKQYHYIPYSHIAHKFGMKHALADQIQQHLDLLPEYKTKLVYAFSNVAGCAIEAIARRLKDDKKDIKGMVCDSGPGDHLIYSSYMLLEEEMHVTSWPLKILGTPAVTIGWSPYLHHDIGHDLDTFPKGFPLLSIRGWRDKMISPKHIDEIFEPHKNLNWKKLSLPEAGHLNGLRDFPSEYRPAVEDFLHQFM